MVNSIRDTGRGLLRTLGGASYLTGIILVVRRAAPLAARLDHRQWWFIMHPWALIGGGTGGGGVRPDAISTSLCRLRRLTNECRLEEE